MTHLTHRDAAAIIADLGAALDRLAVSDDPYTIAQILTDAGARGGGTGSNNPVAVWLQQQVPATAGHFGIRVGQLWIDDHLRVDGRTYTVPGAVYDFLVLYWAGRFPWLVRRPVPAVMVGAVAA